MDSTNSMTTADWYVTADCVGEALDPATYAYYHGFKCAVPPMDQWMQLDQLRGRSDQKGRFMDAAFSERTGIRKTPMAYARVYPESCASASWHQGSISQLLPLAALLILPSLNRATVWGGGLMGSPPLCTIGVAPVSARWGQGWQQVLRWNHRA